MLLQLFITVSLTFLCHFSATIFTGPIGCLKGGTDFCPGPGDSTMDCIGKLTATNRVRIGDQICCLKGNTSNKYMIMSYLSALDKILSHWVFLATFTHPFLIELGIRIFLLEPCFIYLFVLRFYNQVNPLGSCQAQSIYLPHFYWAGLVL